MVWTAYTKLGLDPRNNIIKRFSISGVIIININV